MNDKAENDKFKSIVQNRVSAKYFPSFKVDEMVGLSARAVGKITSSFMVIASSSKRKPSKLSITHERKAGPGNIVKEPSN